MAKVIDVDALTRPLAQGKPCGDNLEYHPDFLALEAAARGRPEQQSGGRDGRPVVIPAEPPAWEEVRRRALSLLERTRDLRVAVLLARAATRIDGLPGLARGLELIAKLVESLWNDVHPQPDPADGDDPVMRINALAALIDPLALLADLRVATFVADERLGRCSVRQLEVALGLVERAGEESIVERGELEAMLRSAAKDGLGNEALDALEQAQRLDLALAERVGAQRSLELEPLMRRLRPVAAFYREVVPGPGQPIDAAAPAAGTAANGVAVGDSAAFGDGPLATLIASGEIHSREEASRLLGKVCDFLERTEPTNPAPLLIRRAQRLMAMSFVDILRDLAPEGVAALSKIAGLPADSK